MAEEILVKESLDNWMIRDGEALTRKLDELGWPVVASFWFYERDENRWKLILASPTFNAGPKKAYEAVAEALSQVQGHFAGLESITIVPPDHPLVQALARLRQTGPGIVGTRVSRNVINGQYIDDAWLYRVNVDPAAA